MVLLEQKSLDNIALKMLMTRFELKTTGVGSDCSDNYSTACAKLFSPITLQNLIAYKIASKLFVSKHLLEFENYSGIANGIYNLKNGFKRYFREKFVVAVPSIAYTRPLGDYLFGHFQLQKFAQSQFVKVGSKFDQLIKNFQNYQNCIFLSFCNISHLQRLERH